MQNILRNKHSFATNIKNGVYTRYNKVKIKSKKDENEDDSEGENLKIRMETLLAREKETILNWKKVLLRV